MNQPLKTILIDDEPLAISRLRRLLTDYTDDIKIIGEAPNGAEGLTMIERDRPDLIFLDIEMPLLNGFEMLARLTQMPLVVFATAYDQYAIRAFEENSVDYLLKPIEADRLARTVARLRTVRDRNSDASITANPFADNMLRLLEQMKLSATPAKREIVSLSVKSGDRMLLIPLPDIAYLEAEDKYVFLVTTEGQKHLTTYTIATLTEKLPDTFLRVSRSTIVNSSRIREVQKHFDGKFILLLTDKKSTRITTGSAYAEAVRGLLEL
jgi:two-component system, LytTR family, response regulator